MNPLRAWIETLRTGNIKQCQNILGSADGSRCCLGVGTDLFVAAGLLPPEARWEPGKDTDYPYDVMVYSTPYTGVESRLLPNDVRDWLGLETKDPLVPLYHTHANDRVHLEPEFPGQDQISLSHLNDTGFTFPQIADVIEWAFWDKLGDA